MLDDLKDAFRNGVLNASTNWRKVYRWATLVTFWAIAAGCLVLAFSVQNLGGNIVHAITLGVNAATFVITSGTATFMFSSTEYHDRTMQSFARIESMGSER